MYVDVRSNSSGSAVSILWSWAGNMDWCCKRGVSVDIRPVTMFF
jgi:hypothetical protein